MHKIRSFAILGLAALLGCLSFASNSALEEYLSRTSVEISASKTAFLPYEPIIIDFVITSHTDFIQQVSPFMGADEQFIIIDENGDTLGKCRSTLYDPPDSLMPHQSYTGRADIRTPHCLTTPGKYTCQLIFDGWGSNLLSFAIIEPEGDLREAWQMYDEAWILGFTRNIESRRKSYMLCLRVIDKYPESIYAPLAMKHILFLYKRIDINNSRDLQLIRDRCKECIDKGNRGIYLDQCLETVVNTSIDLNDRAGAEEYLQSLIDENRSPELTDRATEWLEKLRNRPEKKSGR